MSSPVADLPNGFVHYELAWSRSHSKMRVRLVRDRNRYAQELFNCDWDELTEKDQKAVDNARPFWLFNDLLGKAKVKGCDPNGAIFVYGKLLIRPDGAATFWRREKTE